MEVSLAGRWCSLGWRVPSDIDWQQQHVFNGIEFGWLLGLAYMVDKAVENLIKHHNGGEERLNYTTSIEATPVCIRAAGVKAEASSVLLTARDGASYRLQCASTAGKKNRQMIPRRK